MRRSCWLQVRLRAWATNPHPEQGIISSQRLGLHSLSPDCDTVVMALADQPQIEGQDITDLDSQADIASLRQSLGIDLRWPNPSAG